MRCHNLLDDVEPFMNWFGTQQGKGFEYHLLALGIASALLIMGVARGRWVGRSPALAYASPRT
jgi:hypothetical protein